MLRTAGVVCALVDSSFGLEAGAGRFAPAADRSGVSPKYTIPGWPIGRVAARELQRMKLPQRVGIRGRGVGIQCMKWGRNLLTGPAAVRYTYPDGFARRVFLAPRETPVNGHVHMAGHRVCGREFAKSIPVDANPRESTADTVSWRAARNRGARALSARRCPGPFVYSRAIRRPAEGLVARRCEEWLAAG